LEYLLKLIINISIIVNKHRWEKTTLTSQTGKIFLYQITEDGSKQSRNVQII